MSFILDALERSRRERDAHPVDSAPSSGMGGDSSQESRFPWLPVLLLALLVALVVIAWLWLSRPTAPEEAAVPPALVSAPPVLPRPAPSVETVLAQAAPAAQEATPARAAASASATAVSNLYRDARAAQAMPRNEGRADTEPANDTGGDEPREEASASAATDTSPGVEEQGDKAAADADVDALVARAEAAMDNRGLAEHPAPMLEELSQKTRDSIPTIMYSQHDFRADSSASTVLINRERCGVGDSVGGVRVDEILPDSVVLHYRGTVFRLRALNSWVNL